MPGDSPRVVFLIQLSIFGMGFLTFLRRREGKFLISHFSKRILVGETCHPNRVPSKTQSSMNFKTSRLVAGLTLAILLIWVQAAHSAALLKQNFETTNPWSAMAGYFTAGGGTVTVTPSYTTAGTIDAYGTSIASSGLQLTVDSSAATGNWSAGMNSGVLNLLTINTRGTNFLTLAFSLSASSAYPVRVRIESYDNAATPARTGGLQTLIYPAAGDFYQRYALDLDKMTPEGAGAFVPSASKVRISFELDSTANGTGWPTGTAHTLKIDNINYSTPKYYVKPASIGGLDSNSGLDEANALATVQAAVNKTFSGDNIIAIMEDATPGGEDYVSSDVSGNSFNHVNGDMVNISKPGTPDAWIVFKNYPGQTPVLKSNGWNVFRVRNNSSGSVGAYIEVRGITMRGHSYVDANGDRQIKAAYEPYIGLTDSRTNGNGFGVDGGYHPTNFPHNLRVADCTMEYLAGSNGGSADRQTFENNIIRYNAWWMKYAGSGISFGFARNAETNPVPANPTYRRLIRNNIVHGNECVVPWRRPNANPYSDGNGIIMDSDPGSYTGRTLILNNLVYNNGGSGIHVLKVSNVDIVHNTTFFNSASSSQAYGQIFTQSTGSTADTWVKNVNVTNNIMVAQRRDLSTTNSYLFNEAAMSVASFDPTTIVHKRNVYVGGDNTPSLSGANLSDNTDRGRSYDPALIFVSPSIDPAAADFRLRSAAATNYGAAVGYRSVRDLANSPRSLTGATDTGVYQTLPAVAFSPIFTPKAGNYSGTQNVVLTSDTAGATIVYTTNGTEPTVNASGVPTNGTLYTAAISVSAATTLRAIAWKSGLTTSPVSNAPYTFQNLTSIPVTLSVQTPTGIYPGTQYSQPLTRTPGALFRYTTNGTDPTYNLTTPSASTGIPQDYRGVTVLDYATLRYQAYKPGRANSAIVSTNITVRASVGNTADGTALTTFGAGNMRFVRFHPTSYFSAAYIFARINGVTGNYRAAIYSEASGAPSTRLAACSAVTNPATGWVAFPLTSRVSLSVKDSSNADLYYWLAIWSDNAGAGIYATATDGTVRERVLAYPGSWSDATTNWPNPAGTSTSLAGTANYAIYATNSPPNLAPIVNAGTDQTAISGATVTLNGTVTDDGVPLAAGTVTQTWSKVSGPGTVTFANPASAATTSTFSATGTYVLRLTARDALATATDEVTIVTGVGGSSLDPSPPPGVVRARFTDGLGSTFPQQYPGISGDGWESAWAATNAPTVIVLGTTPLKAGSGNYLSVVRNSGAGSTPLHGVHRQWSNTTRPYDQFARLTFDVRLDSPVTVFNSSTDCLAITARSVPGATPGNESTFLIRAFGAANGPLGAREWGVYNGDGVNSANNINRHVASGMTCDPGETYTFIVDLFGASAAGTTAGKAHGTYDVTITRLSDGATASVLGSRYRSINSGSNAESPVVDYLNGGFLSFSTAQDLATDNLAFSVDSIEMTGLTVMPPVVSSINPADSGELVTFTAKIASSGGSLPPINPTGTVTFLDGVTVLGTGTLDASGEATFSTSALAPGLHSIAASYAGTASYTGSVSTSPALLQTVLSATTTTLSSSVNPSTSGDPVTLTATVEGETFNPTGTVTFLDGAAVLGTVSVNASSVASLSTSALSVGLHPVTARYNGDAGNSGSNSEILDQNVRHVTTTALVSSANPAIVGNPVTFTATISSASGTPSGIVTFFDGVEILGTGTLDGSAVATLTTSALAVGPHSITATYGGDSSQAASRSAAIAQAIDPVPLTPYETWLAARFSEEDLALPERSGPNADPDGDTYDNLLEYAFDTDPHVFTTSGMPIVSRDANNLLSITFARRRADLTYFAEAGSDLLGWTILATDPGVLNSPVTVADEPPPDPDRRFLRSRVVHP